MPFSSTIEEQKCVSRVKRRLGRFSYQVIDFASLSTEVGHAVDSPEFNLCNHTWQLRLFPSGSLPCHKGYVSLYLASRSSKEVRASYKISILNQISGNDNKSYSSLGWRYFKSKMNQLDGWGRDKFMARRELIDNANGFVVNDSIFLEVEIVVHGNLEHFQSAFLPTRTINVNTLEYSLQEMFNDEATSDIRLLVGEKHHILFAHKFILSARSRVFRAMLTSPMLETNTGSIFLDDTDVVVVKEFLRFFYTDNQPSDVIMTHHSLELLALASKYEVPLLVEYCESFISGKVDSSNSLEILQFADLINSHLLRQRALNCISTHSGSVLQSVDFIGLSDKLREEVYLAVERHGNKTYCTCRSENQNASFVPSTCIIM